MRKILTTLVAVAAISAAAVATSSTADARWGGWGWGWGAGPFFAGALVGGALAAAPYYYRPYGPYAYYYGYGPYYGAPGCAWRRVWNGYAWVRGCY